MVAMVRALRDAYAWWRQAVQDQAKYGDALPKSKRDAAPLEPQCGWYKRRLVRGGPFVPGRIWIETPVDDQGDACGDEVMRCVVAGEVKNAETEWTYLCGNPIKENEYKHLVNLSRYAQTNEREPLSSPREKIDINKTPPPVFRQKGKKT
jgi:hypothetical protein